MRQRWFSSLPMQHLEEPSPSLLGQGRCSSACRRAKFPSVGGQTVPLNLSHFCHSLEEYDPFQWWPCRALARRPGWCQSLLNAEMLRGSAGDVTASANTALSSSLYFTPLSNSSAYHPNFADVPHERWLLRRRWRNKHPCLRAICGRETVGKPGLKLGARRCSWKGFNASLTGTQRNGMRS